MLNELRYQKRIKDMNLEEEGYLPVGALFKDETGTNWLNVNAFIKKKYSVFAHHIKKVSNHETGYEISANDFITANADITMKGHSDVFRQYPDLICLSDIRYEGVNVSKEAKKNNDNASLPNKKILKPLYSIFLEPEVMNTVIKRTSIPEIINHRKPIFNGIILHGKGGTGKTVLQKALAAVFENAGGISKELNIARLSEKFIGSLANNLDREIGEIQTRSEKTGKPAFIFLDEASSLVMSASKHNESGVDYYQEAVDVLKKYISNYPDLIFSITTNITSDFFDSTLIRDGRLHPVCIAYPRKKEKIDMWRHFLRLFGIVKTLSHEQYKALAEAIPREQGAFINEFCQNYLAAKKLKMEAKATGSDNLLDVLASGHYISIEKVKETISFQGILEDLYSAVEKKHSRDKNRNAMGFLD